MSHGDTVCRHRPRSAVLPETSRSRARMARFQSWELFVRRATVLAMCGIVGYAGRRPALNIVVDGLRRLEYRGYDSAGVAVLAGSGALITEKRAGKLANLEKALADGTATGMTQGMTGIGHTRWATHGAPNDRNAHPHRSADG